MSTPALVLSCLAAAGLMTLSSADHHGTAAIEPAAIAAPAEDATVMDREGHVLKLGRDGRARRPIPPRFQETSPRCDEGVWMEWAGAYFSENGYAGGRLRGCHMLASDEGAYSAGRTDESQRSPS